MTEYKKSYRIQTGLAEKLRQLFQGLQWIPTGRSGAYIEQPIVPYSGKVIKKYRQKRKIRNKIAKESRRINR